MAINVLFNNNDVDTSGSAAVIPPSDRGPQRVPDQPVAPVTDEDIDNVTSIKKKEPATASKKNNNTLLMVALIAAGVWVIYKYKLLQ